MAKVGGINTLELAEQGVTTSKLADLSITTVKLVDLSVTTAKLALLSVTNAILGLLSVATGNLQDLAVSTAKIADAAVTALKLGAFSSVQVAGQVGAGQNIGNVFTDMSNSTVANVPHNGVSKVLVHADFSGFRGSGPAGPCAVQLMQDGVQVGTIYTFYFNALSSHQGWAFTWVLAAPAAGNHTYKLQVKGDPTGTFTTDGNDYIIVTVTEVGK